MLNSRPDLSVIIVNYRSEQYLESCVASLFKYLQDVAFEIIVVNNDESESLAGIVNKFPEVQVIDHRKNIGFGAAHNLGVKNAQGKRLLLLNPDTEILSADVSKILDELDRDEEVAGIGPRLVTVEGRTQWWCAGKDTSLWQIVKNKIGLSESKKVWDRKEKTLADWVSGTALFVKREAFEGVGGFDEKFFMYFEDMDLCRRMRENGHKIVYYPAFAVLHKGGKSRANIIKQKIQYYRSLAYYLKKSTRNV